MDVLSRVLEKVKLSSTVYFKSDFSAPWGMDIPKGPFAQFHLVTRGQCVLKLQDKTIKLFAGDIVVFPLGTNHWLADSLKSKKVKGIEVVASIKNGRSIFAGEEVTTTLVCGHFEFDRNMNHPFINDLPDFIHIKDSELKELSWLENITNLVIQETGSSKPGNNLVVNKLGEILFIHTIRAYAEINANKKGFLFALKDIRINKALKVIHNNPEINWQLNTLAQTAGMSRTGFSNKFRDLIGYTPLSYLTQWRILQAKELLQESNKSVGEIANLVGYQSETAFNRVFKKNVAKTPLKYRQNI